MDVESPNPEEVLKSGNLCDVSLDEEFCGLCDSFFLSHEEYVQHLDSVTHLKMLVESSFLSQQLYDVFCKILEKFAKYEESCCCRENWSKQLVLYVDHLKCPKSVEKNSIICDAPDDMTEVATEEESAERHALTKALKIRKMQHEQRNILSSNQPEKGSHTTTKENGKPNLHNTKSPRCPVRPVEPLKLSEMTKVAKTLKQNIDTSANGDATNRAMMNYLVRSSNSVGKFSTRVIPPVNNCVGWDMTGSKGWQKRLARNELGISISTISPRSRQLNEQSSSVLNSRDFVNPNQRISYAPDKQTDYECTYAEHDYYHTEKLPSFDGTDLTDELFSEIFSESISSTDTSSFNKPCKRVRSGDRHGNLVFGHDCNFIIFQCFMCKALLTNNNLFAQHYSPCACSVARDSNKDEKSQDCVSLCCLVCNGMVLKSHADMTTHLKLGVHSSAVNKLALEPRLNLITAVAKIKLAENLITILQKMDLHDLETLVSRIEEFRIYANSIIEVLKLLVIFNNSIYHMNDVIVPKELCPEKFIPELKFYFETALKSFEENSSSLRKCRGLFLCTICGAISSNIYNYLLHILFDLEHLAKSSFKLQPVCCMACDKPHLVNDFAKLFESLQKVNPSTGEKYECITLDERDVPFSSSDNGSDSPTKFSIYLEAAKVVKIASLDVNVTYKCRDTSCSDSSKISNLFDLFFHLTSRTHQPPGSEMKLHSCKVECSCCKGIFTSFTTLLVHCVVEAKVKKSKMKVVIQID